MKAHFFKSALPANAGIHGELENGLRWGHRPQRSLGTRIGRVSALALVCAMGAGVAAGQESDPDQSCPPGVEGDKLAEAGECIRELQRLGGFAVRIKAGLIDTPIAVTTFEPCALEVDQWRNGECQRCLLYTSPSPRDKRQSRMPSSA